MQQNTLAETKNETWYRKYQGQQARKVEREQHSLRCDLEIKLNVGAPAGLHVSVGTQHG